MMQSNISCPNLNFRSSVLQFLQTDKKERVDLMILNFDHSTVPALCKWHLVDEVTVSTKLKVCIDARSFLSAHFVSCNAL